MKIPEVIDLLNAAEALGLKVFVVGNGVYTSKVQEGDYDQLVVAQDILDNADRVVEVYQLRRRFRELAESKLDPLEMVRIGRKLGLKFEVNRLHVGSPFAEHYGRITKTGVTFPDYVPPVKEEKEKKTPKSSKKQNVGQTAFSDGKEGKAKRTNKNFIQDGPDLFAELEKETA